MLVIKNLTLRNFLSIGNVTQAIQLDAQGLTLVLGKNEDVSGHNVRNGAGKTSILQAISYALFGKPLTDIKIDNLINNVNGKQMHVSIEFERDGTAYRIERGRKPTLMRYFVNDKLIEEPEDEAQGENRNTQAEINGVLGFTHKMFQHIVALNTFTDPFLKLRVAEQREVIEELLGITQISAKAEALKEQMKSTKDALKSEEFRLKALVESNTKIQNTINDLELKSRAWENERERSLRLVEQQLEKLAELDIEAEIAAHAERSRFNETCRELRSAKRELDTTLQARQVLLSQLERQSRQAEHERTHLANKTCPTCRQPLPDTGAVSLEENEARTEHLIMELTQCRNEIGALQEQIKTVCIQLAACTDANVPQTFYADVGKAYQHRANVEALAAKYERDSAATNPYRDQIDTLQAEGIHEIDYGLLNEFSALLKHQEFLLKLLTSKDSFIRKRIIDQNLSYLNHRLNFYLERLSLPHEVCFKSDLSVDITLLGRDFDFEQLSRGEMNRVILATSWSFRDVWESMNQTMNLLFVDELIDSGLDEQGAEAAFDILKEMARTRDKNVLLISHKDSLISRTSSVLLVRKENSFTHFDVDAELAAIE